MKYVTSAAALGLLAACASAPSGEATYVKTAATFTPTVSAGDQGTVTRRDPLIAGTLRPQGMVVLTEDLTTPRRTFEAGEVLYRSVRGQESSFGEDATAVFCATDKPTQMILKQRTCFQDVDGDGRFDAELEVPYSLPWDLYGLFSAYLQDDPLTGGGYKAFDGETPVIAIRQAAYELCSAEGLPRFRAVTIAEGVRRPSIPCNFGRIGTEGQLSIDRLTVRFDRMDKGLRYEVVEAPNPGLVFTRNKGASFAAVGADGSTKTPLEDSLAALGAALAKPNLASAIDTRLVSQTVSPGEAFLSVPALYGTTGELSEPYTFDDSINRSAISLLGATTELPAGTPVYGVIFGSLQQVLRSPDGVKTTWCTLEKREATGRYGSLCMMPAPQGGTYHGVLRDTLLVTEVTIRSDGVPTWSAPIVQRKPTSLEVEPTFRLVLDRIRDDAIEVRFELDAGGGGKQVLGERRFERGETGEATFDIGGSRGTRVTVTPGGNAATVSFSQDNLPSGTRLY